jgi:hypothetical protein
MLTARGERYSYHVMKQYKVWIQRLLSFKHSGLDLDGQVDIQATSSPVPNDMRLGGLQTRSVVDSPSE